MSYRIVYGKQNGQSHIQMRILIAFVICISLICFGYFGRDLFLPVDAAATGEALEAMVDSVVSGEKLSDAVTTFCREILNNAKSLQ